MTLRTFLVSLLSLSLGLVYPAYGSIAAIESSTGEDDTLWLIYWLMFSLVTILEKVAWPVLQWIPLYGEVKVAILAWLVLPQTKGAFWVYEAILAPALSRGRAELKRFPALERAFSRIEQTNSQTTDLTPEKTAQANLLRRNKLDKLLKQLGSTYDSSLTNLSSIQDPKVRYRAESAFDKDLSRLGKLVTSREASTTTKFV